MNKALYYLTFPQIVLLFIGSICCVHCLKAKAELMPHEFLFLLSYDNIH